MEAQKRPGNKWGNEGLEVKELGLGDYGAGCQGLALRNADFLNRGASGDPLLDSAIGVPPHDHMKLF